MFFIKKNSKQTKHVNEFLLKKKRFKVNTQCNLFHKFAFMQIIERMNMCYVPLSWAFLVLIFHYIFVKLPKEHGSEIYFYFFFF